jgi:hypothetical protein
MFIFRNCSGDGFSLVSGAPVDGVSFALAVCACIVLPVKNVDSFQFSATMDRKWMMFDVDEEN